MKKNEILFKFAAVNARFGLVYGKSVRNRFPVHPHSNYVIGIVSGGERVFFINGQRNILRKGGVFTVNPDQPHYCEDNGSSYSAVSIPVEYINGKIPAPYVNCEAVIKNIIHDKTLYHELEKLFQLSVLNNSRDDYNKKLDSVIKRLIGKYSSQRLRRNSLENARLAGIRDYIREKCHENVSLDELSQAAFCSRFHFTRLFKQAFGIPPHVYLRQMRLNKALKDLRIGKPITAVALDLGFYDQSHFSKSFKKYAGVNPKSFAAINKSPVK